MSLALTGTQMTTSGESAIRSAAGSAAEQAMVHSVKPTFMPLCDGWSGQCCIGIADVTGRLAAAGAIPNGMMSMARRMSRRSISRRVRVR